MNAALRRPTRIEIDAAAISANAAAVAALVAPAELCAVVKADGYGHGALTAARAALDGGATSLAVALVDEGAALREAGLTAPVLVLGEPEPASLGDALSLGLTPTIATAEGAAAVREWTHRTSRRAPVHLKVDTGMHRVGVDPRDVVALARSLTEGGVLLDGLWTHLACADDPASPVTADQLRRFDDCVDELHRHGIVARTTHVANSAGALLHPGSRRDMVRCGIAVYGIHPSPAVQSHTSLRPAMSVHTRVTAVRRVAGGEGVSYGHVGRTERPTTVATLPIGYADGYPRRCGISGVEVLIGGRRRRLIGVVTMDQCMVDCGDDPIRVGDEVVLVGSQGSETITAQEIADLIGTIAYEVVCAFGPRIPREAADA